MKSPNLHVRNFGFGEHFLHARSPILKQSAMPEVINQMSNNYRVYSFNVQHDQSSVPTQPIPPSVV